MGLLGDAFDSALSGIFGGSESSSASSSGSGYGGLIDSLFSSGEASYHKVDKSRDEGISGYGSQDQYMPAGTTFMKHGKRYGSTEEYLRDLDQTTCYSGTLRCPVCGNPKNSPSEVELCKAEHRRNGYNC